MSSDNEPHEYWGYWTPLDVRYGGPRKRFAWRIKLLRERLALRLAPWLATGRGHRPFPEPPKETP